MKVKVIKMANTNKRYEPEFKKKMVRLVLEEGRTIASVNKEYNLGEGTVRSWIRQFEEECEKNHWNGSEKSKSICKDRQENIQSYGKCQR